MLMSGVAGGVVAQALLARPGGAAMQQTAAVQPAQFATPPPGVATTAVEIDLDRRLAALRAELRQEMRAEMDRVDRISVERARPASVPEEVRYTLTLLQNDVVGVKNDVVGVKRRQSGIEDQFEGLVLTSQAQATPVSLQGR
jgi:hypothetical protein